jgi:hypothetical protein
MLLCFSPSLSALSALPVVARAEDAPEPDWQETVTSDVIKFRGFDLTSDGKTMNIPKGFWRSASGASRSPNICIGDLPLDSDHRSPLTQHFFRSSTNPASSAETDTARRMSAEKT